MTQRTAFVLSVVCGAFLLSRLPAATPYALALSAPQGKADKDKPEGKPKEKGGSLPPEATAKQLQGKLPEALRKRGTRLERVVTKTDPKDDDSPLSLHFTGRFFHAGDDDAKELRKQLQDWLTPECEKLPELKGVTIKINLDGVQAVRNPVFDLQEQVVKAELDGSLFETAWYEPDGTLHLGGVLGAAAHAERLKELLKKSLDKSLLVDDRWSIEQMKPVKLGEPGKETTWTEVVLSIQRELANSKEARSKQTRLDRAYFVYEGNLLRLACVGVGLHTRTEKKDDVHKELSQQLLAASQRVLTAPGNFAVLTKQIEVLESPFYQLQDKAVEAGVDGVLFVTAFYDANRTLQFGGYVGAREQQPVLEKLVETTLKDSKYLRPAVVEKEKRSSCTPMTPFKTAQGKEVPTWDRAVREVQLQLAKLGTEGATPTRVDRLYFNYEAEFVRLISEGAHLHAKAAPAVDLHKELGKQLLTISQGLIEEPANFAVKTEKIALIETPLLDFQRRALAEKVDGILFTNLWFDGAGRLVMSGIRDTALSPERLHELVRKWADKTALLGPEGPGPLEHMKAIDWKAKLATLQAQFAADADRLFKQTRLDRVYFERLAGAEQPLLHFGGVCIYQSKTAQKSETLGKLSARLQSSLETEKLACKVVVADIQFVDNPRALLQELFDDFGPIHLNLDVTLKLLAYGANGRLEYQLFGVSEELRSQLEQFANAILDGSPVLSPTTRQQEQRVEKR